MSLSMILFKYVMNEQVGLTGGAGVSLSAFRKHYRIPKSTFYRAVRVLIDEGVVCKCKRDSYVVHAELIKNLLRLRMNYDGEVQLELGF